VATTNSGILWVADSVNRYIKKFDNAASLPDYQLPTATLGTGTASVSQNSFYYPSYLGIDKVNGHLFVSDTFFISLFKNAQNKANAAPADTVFGSSSFTAGNNSCTQFFVGDTPQEAFYDAPTDTLFVDDVFNSRIMVWENALTASNGSAASQVLGQFDFITCVDPGASAGAANWDKPNGLDYNSATGIGFIAGDESYSRYLRMDCTPSSPSITGSTPASPSVPASVGVSPSVSLSQAAASATKSPAVASSVVASSAAAASATRSKSVAAVSQSAAAASATKSPAVAASSVAASQAAASATKSPAAAVSQSVTKSPSSTPSVTKVVVAASSVGASSVEASVAASSVVVKSSISGVKSKTLTGAAAIACRQQCQINFASCKRTTRKLRPCRRTKKQCVSGCGVV